jgi:hypothetical protein
MLYDYSKLRGRIREIIGNEYKFAKLLGKSKNTLSCKLNSRIEFTQSEIKKACHLLKIEPSQMQDYFFQVKIPDEDEDEFAGIGVMKCSAKT